MISCIEVAMIDPYSLSSDVSDALFYDCRFNGQVSGSVGLWFIRLIEDGYAPEFIYVGDGTDPVVRFSYNGKDVSIIIRHGDLAIYPYDYYLIDDERYVWYNTDWLLDYIHEEYPVIQSKKEAAEREIRAF